MPLHHCDTVAAARLGGAGRPEQGPLEKPEEVFELLGDPTPHAEMEPVGAGSRFRQTSRTLGIRFPMLLEVIEYEPNHRIAPKSVWPARSLTAASGGFDPTDTVTRGNFGGPCDSSERCTSSTRSPSASVAVKSTATVKQSSGGWM
jgi:hypothetical protein